METLIDPLNAGDRAAAHVQLQLLQQQWQELQDSKRALSLYLIEYYSDDEEILDDLVLVDEDREAQLRAQIDSLSRFVAAADDQQVALETVLCEEAQQAASLQLATALQSSEAWEAEVQQPHDDAVARSIAACREREWAERGLLLQQPLDLSDRPSVPQEAGSDTSCTEAITPDSPTTTSSSSRALWDQHAAKHKAHSLKDPQQAASSSGAAAGSSGGSTGLQPNDACGSSGSSDGLRVQCGICFDVFPANAVLSATLPAEMASSSRAGGHCSHWFCRGCMGQWVESQLQARRYPVYCPNPECSEELAAADVTQLLADNKHKLQVFTSLAAEHLIAQERRVYCPFKGCSVLLERPEGPEQQQEQEAPFECPSCNRSFCLSCGVAGWHTGMSCKEYQALPPELQSAEDAALLHLRKQKHWRPCPNCSFTVERTQGCNHITCRCGCHWCYACGTRYRSSTPSANNVHGTPGCNCELFAVPPEGAEAEPAAAPVVLQRLQDRPRGQGARPFRNGRLVSHTPCRHARSIHDCPHGEHRCWFWHDEDDTHEEDFLNGVDAAVLAGLYGDDTDSD